jgi:uncharacterized protein
MEESFLARLPKGADLLSAITEEFRKRSIRRGRFVAIGAVERAVLAFYDQAAKQYGSREFNEQLEIVSCVGNVSLRDDDLFAHAHVVLSNAEYGCIGGHLVAGAPIFAAELYGCPVPGNELVRTLDDPTGLYLWSEW